MNKIKDQNKFPREPTKPGTEISRRELFEQFSPFGRVTLDSSQCTGCGLCTLECPTWALIISSDEETGVFQLLFKHSSCVACSYCVEICPENCLHMERVLGLDNIRGQSTLLEGKLVRCSECSSPIGPKAMVDKLQAKVEATGNAFSYQAELCPRCKVQAQFSQLRT